jgi:hypothetical protein
MTEKTLPYFMSNPAWYVLDEETGRYRLTPNAPVEALKSFEDFYSDDENLFEEDERGIA